jgi:hypothetical protein
MQPLKNRLPLKDGANFVRGRATVKICTVKNLQKSEQPLN